MRIKLIDLEWDKKVGCAILEWLHLLRPADDARVEASLQRIDEIEESLARIENQVIRIRMLRAQTNAERTRTQGRKGDTTQYGMVE